MFTLGSEENARDSLHERANSESEHAPRVPGFPWVGKCCGPVWALGTVPGTHPRKSVVLAPLVDSHPLVQSSQGTVWPCPCPCTAFRALAEPKSWNIRKSVRSNGGRGRAVTHWMNEIKSQKSPPLPALFPFGAVLGSGHFLCQQGPPVTTHCVWDFWAGP